MLHAPTSASDYGRPHSRHRHMIHMISESLLPQIRHLGTNPRSLLPAARPPPSSIESHMVPPVSCTCTCRGKVPYCTSYATFPLSAQRKSGITGTVRHFFYIQNSDSRGSTPGCRKWYQLCHFSAPLRASRRSGIITGAVRHFSSLRPLFDFYVTHRPPRHRVTAASSGTTHTRWCWCRSTGASRVSPVRTLARPSAGYGSYRRGGEEIPAEIPAGGGLRDAPRPLTAQLGLYLYL